MPPVGAHAAAPAERRGHSMEQQVRQASTDGLPATTSASRSEWDGGRGISTTIGPNVAHMRRSSALG